MIKLRISFFGATADAVDARIKMIEFAEGETVGSLVAILSDEFPRLRNHKLLIAVNEEYSEFDAVLRNNDEVAVFTAVSGG
jgi:molybdopterin converting factor small subunit